MKTVLRRVGIAVLALVLLVVVGYVAHGVHGTVEVAAARKAAVADLAAALPRAQQEATRDRDQVRAAYVPRWGRPSYSWQELVCELDTVDTGWIAQYYTQECRIRSVDLIPAAAGAPSDRCAWSPLPGASGSRPPNERHVDASATIGPSTAFAEQRPYRLDCPDGVLAPSILGVTRLLGGSRPASLAASPAWIVVTVSTDVSTSRLGCDPWTIVFCSEPVGRPVLGHVSRA